jgi:predicted NAD/FAD-binding protein/cyclopropane fatty-acyl-phospholipid synthase-like methyltransferase
MQELFAVSAHCHRLSCSTHLMMLPMEEFQTFLADASAQAYMVVVSVAIYFSLRRYYTCESSKSRPSLLPPLLSLCVLGVTWFYIFRFIVTHIHTSKSYFGDAYRDVLKDEGQHMISVQLLTWAIVAVTWMEDEGTVSDLVFLGYGFLGAMGASFVLWVPSLYRRSDRSRVNGRRTVSLFSVLCAIAAFLCIVNISPCSNGDDEVCENDERFGSFRPSFEMWLHGLHYVLLVPALGKLLPPLRRVRVDAAMVYFVIGIVLSQWHFSLLISSNQTGLGFVLSNVMSDCQISITTDFVCCSFITLFTIYKDNLLYAKAGWFGSKANDSMAAKNTALFRTSLAAFGLVLASPGAVLAFHLCSRCASASHMAVVARAQQWMANKIRAKSSSKNERNEKISTVQGPSWCNLGIWTETKMQLCGYDEACQRLAVALANSAGLTSDDGVLCCGCGSGPELELYKNEFKLKHITGIDPGMDRVAAWEQNRLLKGGDFNIRRMEASVEDLRTSTGSELFGSHLFNKILALDNVYHYASKYNFFRDCAALLPAGGKVAVTDVLATETVTPLWVRLLLVALGIPDHNLWTRNEYIQYLSDLGFTDVQVQSTEGRVFKGWERYLPQRVLQYLDYSIVVATMPKTNQTQTPIKKKVAIIGSGLAGLAAAHSLVTSSEAVEVTIYEANKSPGLAGHSTWYEDHLIDIPPRMASEGYYKEYRKMLTSLKIPTQVVGTDCTYYGGDENGGESTVYASYDMSNAVKNFLSAIFKGGFSNFWKLAVAMSKTGSETDCHESHHSTTTTFGDWLNKHSLYSAHTTDSLEICRDNPFLYLIIGSLGWMLSCTYQQLLEYPADIILPYLHSLYLRSTSLRGDGSVVRVNPSIKVFEQSLLYGVERLTCDIRVSGLDQMKTINGVKYDSIICATEASAVPKVLKQPPKVFAKVKYHPSVIYLHTDESFMPPNKKDWRRWTVQMKHGLDEPQLTFWLNKVYPDSRFSTNVFQTWAPSHDPKPETIIKKACFQRVVHTTCTRNLVTEIESEQGKDGIYFAGSYTVYGMGLLEQALISGRNAANRAVADMFDGDKTK